MKFTRSPHGQQTPHKHAILWSSRTSIEYIADPRAAHEDTPVGDYRFAISIQHLADGRADAPVVYDGEYRPTNVLPLQAVQESRDLWARPANPLTCVRGKLSTEEPGYLSDFVSIQIFPLDNS
jgi:hypothetical protein